MKKLVLFCGLTIFGLKAMYPGGPRASSPVTRVPSPVNPDFMLQHAELAIQEYGQRIATVMEYLHNNLGKSIASEILKTLPESKVLELSNLIAEQTKTNKKK